ncbi:hypothetical protein BDZ89DRAFT_1064113 [Hymenopellis radicata]|nr:hypothetical protein BDZ89DRAFT_1064113 [Hymenopellis radicata]
MDGYPPEIASLLTTLRSQLTTQATVISSLATQRDLLVHTIEEERARWDGEREGWERSAEALIRRRPAGSNIDREELERRNGLLEGEVRGKTAKLNDALARLAALEHELSELKPLLLLPTPPAFAPQTSTSKYYPSYVVPSPSRPRTVNHYDRRATPAPVSPKRKIDTYSADARIEHLLLATRRLGRERVANSTNGGKKKTRSKTTSTHYRETRPSTSRQAPSPRASRKTPLDRLVSAAAAMSQDEMNQPPKRRRISGGGGSMLDVLAAAAERREPTPRVIAPPTPSSSRVIRTGTPSASRFPLPLPLPPAPVPQPVHSLTAALNAAAVNNVKRRRKRDDPPPRTTTGFVEFHLAAPQPDGDHDAEGSDDD